jgi:SlyX protein
MRKLDTNLNAWKSAMPDITDRIDELESRLAHHEKMQEELSAVIAEQGKIIDQLREQARRQNDKLRELADDMSQKAPGDVTPPHY